MMIKYLFLYFCHFFIRMRKLYCIEFYTQMDERMSAREYADYYRQRRRLLIGHLARLRARLRLCVLWQCHHYMRTYRQFLVKYYIKYYKINNSRVLHVLQSINCTLPFRVNMPMCTTSNYPLAYRGKNAVFFFRVHSYFLLSSRCRMHNFGRISMCVRVSRMTSDNDERSQIRLYNIYYNCI